MMYSQSPESSKLSLFALFLYHLINGESKYKKTIDTALKEAHELASRKKNFYEIDRSLYQVIVHLNDVDHQFFSELDPNSLGKERYKEVLNMLRKPSSYELAE